jgi:hypothetical protein
MSGPALTAYFFPASSWRTTAEKRRPRTSVPGIAALAAGDTRNVASSNSVPGLPRPWPPASTRVG